MSFYKALITGLKRLFQTVKRVVFLQHYYKVTRRLVFNLFKGQNLKVFSRTFCSQETSTETAESAVVESQSHVKLLNLVNGIIRHIWSSKTYLLRTTHYKVCFPRRKGMLFSILFEVQSGK